jgi:hypothetical protein
MRSSSDEHYVINLCDEALGAKASRQHRFDFLIGDPGRNGRRTRLPVDAYYERLKLVVEYFERQHDEPVPHFDKPYRMTISGVHRGQQRRLYDRRREIVLPRHGLSLVRLRVTDFPNRNDRSLLRQQLVDQEIVREKLARFL